MCIVKMLGSEGAKKNTKALRLGGTFYRGGYMKLFSLSLALHIIIIVETYGTHILTL